MLLTTLGYEGSDVQTFFDVLQKNNIQVIVDIRELPISRKPGFSKTALSNHAKSCGIKYMHLGELGSPRNIRHAYRDDYNWEKFSSRYLEYLNTQDESIKRLADVVRKESCCLICFEADPGHCHRQYVAKALLECVSGDLAVKHLAA
jgi:uncharacterized protein (DUF488 family)